MKPKSGAHIFFPTRLKGTTPCKIKVYFTDLQSYVA